MEKATVFNSNGEIVEEVELAEIPFEIEPNPYVVQQYVKTYLENQAQDSANTKDRSEVKGGGKKPWRQKGTGRARHGSRTSPIWRHGGVTFGPDPIKTRDDLPKKMKRLSFASVLADRAQENRIYILEGLDFEVQKTSILDSLLKSLGLPKEGNKIIITDKPDKDLVRIGRNIPNLEISFTGEVCTYDILKAEYLIFYKEAINNIEDFYEEKLKNKEE